MSFNEQVANTKTAKTDNDVELEHCDTQSSLKYSYFRENPLNATHWKITNDGVMGGLSNGDIIVNKTNQLIFLGHVSTDNNGGFTSVFSDIPKLLPQFYKITIRVLGDGKLYQLRAKSKIMGIEVGFKAEFQTKQNQETLHQFNIADFTATFRGRTLANVQPLQADLISSIGFLIKSNQSGDFRLVINSIVFE